MKLEQLRYLIDLSLTGSITNTAERFYITQQAISSNIKNLEQEFQCQILNRTKVGISFTSDGEKILDFAKQTLFLYEQCQNNLTQSIFASSQQQRKIGIYTFSPISNIVIPRTYNVLKKRFPKLKFTIRDVSDPETGCQALQNNYCDLVFVSLNEDFYTMLRAKTEYQNVCMDILCKDRFVACMRACSQYASSSPLTINESMYINELNCYGVSPYYHLYNNLTAQMLLVSNDVESHKELLKKNDVVIIMPKLAANYFFSGKSYKHRECESSINVLHLLLYLNNPDDILSTCIQNFKMIIDNISL